MQRTIILRVIVSLPCLLPVAALFMSVRAKAQDPIRLTIEAGQPAAKSSPMLYGLMTEEINHSYDGGLYAELIRNRAFMDDVRVPAHWAAVQANGSSAAISLDPKQPLNSALTTSLRLEVASASFTARAGVCNDGYWGIPVKA